jgi:5'(3')-deoxyribonucleotidase
VRIGLDVDGVLADIHTPWLLRLSARVAQVPAWTPDDLTQWEFWDTFGVTAELVWSLYTPEIYADVEPYAGIRDQVLEIARLGHTVVFVTASRGQEMFEAKREWLYRHALVMGTAEIHAVGPQFDMKTKGDPRLRLDWMLDDNLDNLDEVAKTGAYTVMLTQPHNRRLLHRHRRVKSVREFVQILSYHKPEGLLKPAGSTLDDVMASYNYTADHCAAPAPTTGAACWAKPAMLVGGCVIGPDVGKVSDVPVYAKPAPPTSLPNEAAARKAVPIMTGVLDYFPAALAEVARVSKAGSDQHHPGQPMHWERGKSYDHADSAVRHLMERGGFDSDGRRHSAKAAWRALANLQQELEDAGEAPVSRASKP